MVPLLSIKLLDWFNLNARILPWRQNPQPYRIWIAEIMLQQTRVDTVIPYFNRWMEEFPDIRSVAQADQVDVLRVWEGLGYYARARNLHQAAQIIQEKYHGELPKKPEELRSLPGIGEYSANAIASIAFNVDLPTLDGNISRVLARLIALEAPVQDKTSRQTLLNFASTLLPIGHAGEFNQALMELGALVCLPHKPHCDQCPLIENCQSFTKGVQEKIPQKLSKKNLPHITATAGVIWQNHRVLIAQRPPKGLLGGLWEFPGGKLEDGETLEDCLLRELKEELDLPVEIDKKIAVYQHTYTHFRITLHAYCCHPLTHPMPKPKIQQAFYWVATSELSQFPMGKIDRQIAQSIFKESLC